MSTLDAGIMAELVPVDDLDAALLDPSGRLKALFPAEVFRAHPALKLKLWCHLRARYGLPTLELVTWLRQRIAGREALEIGSGNGDLGYLAGIRETDSYIQQAPLLQEYYRQLRQAPTSPPPAVRQMDALAAIDKFKPKVVVASWFTRKFVTGVDREGAAQASVYGVREEEIIERVETYIHIGNESVHAQKTALSLSHKEITFPGLISRSLRQENNVIYVWDRKP